MKIQVSILARNPGGNWAVVHSFVTHHDTDTERKHFGFLCRYLFEHGMGVQTTPL